MGVSAGRLLILAAALAVVAVVVIAQLWHRQAGTPLSVPLRGRGGRPLSVQEALQLCPRGGTLGGTLHLGTLTVTGIPATVPTIFSVGGTLEGLFSSRQAAQSQSSRTTDAVYPPSDTAIWLRDSRVPESAGMLSVTGEYVCTTQLGGAGDNSGTFGWLTVVNATHYPHQ